MRGRVASAGALPCAGIRASTGASAGALVVGPVTHPADDREPRRRPLGVLVHVLLAGQLHDGVHDLVRHRPEYDPVLFQTVVTREIQRRAEPHPWAYVQPRPDLP